MKIRGFERVRKEYRYHQEESILPKRATSQAAAYDFYAPEDVVIEPLKSMMIWTDIKAYCANDEVLLLNVRSSMGKQPVMLANTQGWIDADYYENPDNDGNIGIRLFNLGDTPYTIHKGDRIAQGMFIHYLEADGGQSDAIRQGGFGSTNK